MVWNLKPYISFFKFLYLMGDYFAILLIILVIIVVSFFIIGLLRRIINFFILNYKNYIYTYYIQKHQQTNIYKCYFMRKMIICTLCLLFIPKYLIDFLRIVFLIINYGNFIGLLKRLFFKY